MNGLVVIGTDTGVGKTLVAALLMRAAAADVRYWKPIETGIACGGDAVGTPAGPPDPGVLPSEATAGDTETVLTLAELPPKRALDRGVRLPHAASPHRAAWLAGLPVDVEGLVATAKRETGRFVVETAGGLLVPLDGRTLQADLLGRFGLPCLLVASTRLGTINHTLLTLSELRRRDLACLGVVLSGPPSASARTALENHARDLAVVELAPFDPAEPGAFARQAQQWASLAFVTEVLG